MNNLFILSESFTNGYRAEILDILSLFAILMWNICYYK